MAFLTKRLWRWLVVALVVPLSVMLADLVADRIEANRGPSRLTRFLRLPGRWRRGESMLAD